MLGEFKLSISEKYQPRTFIESLRWRTYHQPDKQAYIFLADGESQEITLTYRELDTKARAIAATLQELLQPGERALLLYPPGIEYIAAFFGCLYAGVIAVPAYPPHSNRLLSRIQAISDDAKVALVLTTTQMLARSQQWFRYLPELAHFRWMTTDALSSEKSSAWQEQAFSPETLAFLQYTSGSTSTPKGVMVSHGNLIHNVQMITQIEGNTEHFVSVSWLPIFHDLGLIGGILQPLYAGFPSVLMAPTAFLQRPLRWLQAISRYRGTVSSAPNFAYELCLERVLSEELEQLDLSSWQLAVNAAEPVRWETLDRFAKMFATCGFQRKALTPAYGLAEGTLLVSLGHMDEEPLGIPLHKDTLKQHRLVECTSFSADALMAVGCGSTSLEQRVVIVNPETLLRCGPDEIGEIWLSGRSVAQGYWNNTGATRDTFQAYISDTGEGPFLRTGDLGFLRQGQVFITSRLKDLVIIRGQNHSPQDIELTVERCHRSLRPACGAAFTIEIANEGSGTDSSLARAVEERLVIVQELQRHHDNIDDIFAAIRQAVVQAHEIEVYAIVLVKFGGVPKTSSGKIQRRTCREQFLNEELEIIATSYLQTTFTKPKHSSSLSRDTLRSLDRQSGREQLEQYLFDLLQQIIGITSVQFDQAHHLSALGIDSLKASELKNHIDHDFHIDMPITSFFQDSEMNEFFDEILSSITEEQHFQSEPILIHQEEQSEYPLSYSQEQSWFLDQLEPGNALYNVPVALRLQGMLDIIHLERCVNAIVQRHTTLRTTFGVEQGSPIQCVHDNLFISIEIEDLADLAEKEREIALRQRVQQLTDLPFDLSSGPLLRVWILRVEEHHHVLLIVMHHIICDEHSIKLFFQELSLLYSNTENELPVSTIYYADYVCWQRQLIYSEHLNTQLLYWQHQLKDLEPLTLPTTYPRPSVQRHQGGTYRFTFSPLLLQEMRQLSRREGVTLFMTLLTSFQTLLARYSGQTDIAVGTPIANRSKIEIEKLIGYFVNVLVLRSDVSGNPTFRELLRRVRNVCVEAYQHQDFPFLKLVEHLRPLRDLSRNPLFQVFFALDMDLQNTIRLPSIAVEPMNIEYTTAKFDLSFTVAETVHGLEGRVEYDLDIFDQGTIIRLVEHWELLLSGLLHEQDQRVMHIEFLTAREQQFLQEWNRTGQLYPDYTCVHQLFEQQVEQRPDAIALFYDDSQLTYRELNQLANQLASYLVNLGVEPEMRVGLCLSRSLNLVVGLLGILKAGAAYVPLDPDHPQERLNFLLEDAQVAVLLLDRQKKKDFSFSSVRMVCLEEEWEHIAAFPSSNSINRARATNLAYMIYTSGSTGKPKGVQIEHRALTNFLYSMQQRPGLIAQDILLAVTTVSFDIAALEMFLPLVSGAQIVLVGRDVATDGVLLGRAIEQHGITIMQATPATWRMLLDAGWQGKSDLKSDLKILCGGEALPLDLARQLQACCSSLWNMYGPTETTIWSTVAMIEMGADVISLGYPIANTMVYVLDDQLQPVPPGVIGELYIGGDGLARGYFNRPELSAERFLPDPFRKEVGARLYKVGDLACYRHGKLEYMGRNDYQVKIHGFRIEVGEVEAVLKVQPHVRECVVIAREDTPGDKRLVAYVVPSEEHKPTSTLLRKLLQEQLPEYMIPAIFVFIEGLPLTANGKIDRRALPAPGSYETEQAYRYVAPRTPVEELLASIWSAVLGVEQVSILANFFEMGGHSLLATQVISRLRSTFQITVPLRWFFELPTVVQLAERIEMMQRTTDQDIPLQVVPRQEAFPLSFAQQGLWFFDQLAPGNSRYNLPFAAHLAGMLSVVTLEKSLNEIIRRHEVLRTTFTSSVGNPVQIIHSHLTISVPLIDLSDFVLAEREHLAHLYITQEAMISFDLNLGPLVRITLLRFSHEEHILILNMHHIISDGWSMGIFVRELATLYEAFLGDNPSPLTPLAFQYVDYVVWQRQWMQGKLREEQLAYWKQQLANSPTSLALPVDRPRSSNQTFAGAQISFTLTASLVSRLKELSRSEGSTLFMTLLAAFEIVLYRYSGQEEFIIGSPIAGRTGTEIEILIGLFINTLALRADLTGDPSYREVLRRVRKVALEAYAHQDVPFEQVVEALQPERNMSYSPLFQVVFALQNVPIPPLQLAGLHLTPLEVKSQNAKFDLILSLIENEQRLTGILEYNTDLFDAATIERMAGHFFTLLEGIVVDPAQQISTIPLFTTQEHKQLFYLYNNPVVSASHECLHHLFESVVEQTPEAIALVLDEKQLSYRELNLRANQVAHYLQDLGVGPETRVGLCMHHSFDLIISLLGILKAGGAYVPLDPAYPPERLLFLLSDSQASLVVTHAAHLELLAGSSAHLVCLDTEQKAISQADDSNPDSDATASNLAYVIYTSGSTGTPKGVMVCHMHVTRLFNSIKAWLQFDAQDVWTLFHSYAFDFSVWELWGALLFGGRLVIVPHWLSRSPDTFYDLVRRERVTVLNQTPSAFHLFMQAEEEASQDDNTLSLRYVIFGGEALDMKSLAPWFQRHGDHEPQLVNMYGITETTIHVTCHTIGSSDVHQAAGSIIGKPLPDLRLCVLDAHLQPVPLGIPGEMYVGGAGVARGYLNGPAMTAERFLPDPFSTDPGARLYKTGDIARYLANGELEYLGRNDQQVKLRGFRIEPGEIELALQRHAGVRASVVAVHEHARLGKSLVAYILPQEEQVLNASEIRRFLQSQLPDYMLPAHFIFLDTLPLTHHGKIDRHALPSPDVYKVELEAAYLPPRTPVEEMLVNIWAEVLSVKQVDIHETFFDLGGHSLLATQVIARMRSAFQVIFPLRWLFEAPTIAELAERIEEDRRMTQGGTDATPPLLPIPRHGPLPLSFAQQRLWFLDQVTPDSLAYNMPSAVRLTGILNITALMQSMNAIIQRHEILRTHFTTLRGTPLQNILAYSPLSFPVIDLSGLVENVSEQEILRLAHSETRYVFDLFTPGLLHMFLLRINKTDHVLVLNAHHSIWDGWSIGVFLHELAVHYEAYTTGSLPLLSPLPVQYADYATWQRQWLQGEIREQQIAYWKEQLQGTAPVLHLPTDYPRPAVQTTRGAYELFTIPGDLTESIRAFSRQEEVTLFMTLLAAFVVLLARYSKQEDIVVGTPTAGRVRRELEWLIGCFVNTLALRTNLSGKPTVRELLRQIRETALGAYTHQDLPFEQVVDALQVPRNLSYTPLFQVMFILHNMPIPPLELRDIKITPLEVQSEAAKFDLTLSLLETEQGIQGAIHYNCDLFQTATIQHMIEHFQIALTSLIMQPDSRIEELLPEVAAGRENAQIQQYAIQTEAGEIEEVLRLHPAVQQCAVLLHEEHTEEKQFIAYLIPRNHASLTREELYHFLQERLHNTALSVIFTIIYAIPLTADGEVDYQALTMLAENRPMSTKEFSPPRTPLEVFLVDLWKEMLDQAEVGIYDHFFDSGGDSIKAAIFINKLQEEIEAHIHVVAIFNAPTIASLSHYLIEHYPDAIASRFGTETLTDAVLQEVAVQGTTAQKSTQQAVPVSIVQDKQSHYRLDNLGREEPSFTRIKRRSKQTHLPLSFAQQRLWFLNQLQSDSSFYNMPASIRLKGSLHREPLSQALNEIIRRHETLRTTFVFVDTEPAQIIAPLFELPLLLEDLTGLPEEQQEAEVLRIGIQVAQQPFDLQRGPLVRARLLRLKETEHVLLFDLHHIISDGWSLGILAREFAILYQVFLEGQPSPLPELSVQYADFAIWQRQWLQSQNIQEQLEYWKQSLNGAPPLLHLPTDHPRPAVQTFQGAHYLFHVPLALMEQLKVFSQQEGTTLFMTLLAVFKMLLFRYSGLEDIVVGSPIAGRTRAEIEDLIGFFVNTLVLHTDLSGSPSFRELLARVRTVTLGAYKHQDIPFEKLVEVLAPERQLSQMPLFQVAFVLQNTPVPPHHIAGLEVSLMEIESRTSKFDLTLAVRETEQGLQGMIEYSTDLFHLSTIELLAEYFQALLVAVIAHPEQSITQFPLISAQKRSQLLRGKTLRKAIKPRDMGLHHLFERQAERTPSAVAVLYEREHLSYSELNARANQLAHSLQENGVGPEVRVGLCVERSLDLVVGVLGILKAGGTYVPLDSDYPTERLAFLLTDAHITVLVTLSSLLERIPDCYDTVVCLDSDHIGYQSRENPVSGTTAENLAYIIYTSGSTGKPKGVMVSHANVKRLFTSTHDWFRFDERDVWTLFHSCAFDFSVWELWGALLYGGQLVVVPCWITRTPDLFYELIISARVTVLNQTPSAFRQLLDVEVTREKPALQSLRWIIFGGEALNIGGLQPWVQRYGDQIPSLVNMYGITETTVHVTYRLLTTDDIVNRAGSVIGEPIPDVQTYVLDENLQLVPPGVVGELYIGGAGVARGYLDRPALTAERFLPDPFSDLRGARLYKTGDTARWLADGDLEYVGRNDQQIKLRGYRIEAGEIEATLKKQPTVRDAIVVARDDLSGEKQLVAYLVQDSSSVAEKGTEKTDSTVQVIQWQRIFDEIYSQEHAAEDYLFNIKGWDSSYTNQPLPAEQMREWVEGTCERIRELRPQRVLEIGCGTGLLLFRLAPSCVAYYGTDISAEVLQNVQFHLDRQQLSHVSLLQRAADDLRGLETQRFDVVILNSVVQYFPDIDYLFQVLQNIVPLLEADGCIFIGDVRQLPLLEAFHTSVELYKASYTFSTKELQRRIRKRMLQESELIIDSAFFMALKQYLPRIQQVIVQPKHGRFHNELTKFRYDVKLFLDTEQAPLEALSWQDWQERQLTLPTLRQMLQETTPEILAFSSIPNARLLADVEAVALLNSDQRSLIAGDLKKTVQQATLDGGIDPEHLWGLGYEFPYRVDIYLSHVGKEGYYDLVLRPWGAERRVHQVSSALIHQKATSLSSQWHTYANNPRQNQLARQFLPALKKALQTQLPEYMLPSVFVVLDALPLTLNGKVDQRALPVPDDVRPELATPFIAPRTPLEQALADIWSEVLGIGEVGIQDQFFDLGGHSLLATQVVARIRQAFHVEIPLRQFFATPTIEHLVSFVEDALRTEQGNPLPIIQAISLLEPQPLSFAQQRLWFLNELQPQITAYNIPLAVRLHGNLNLEALESSLHELGQRHKTLQTNFTRSEDEPRQVIDSQAIFPLSYLDLSALPAEERETQARQLAIQVARYHFNLAQGPLVRVVLIRLNAQEYILTLCMHHIISDGWSMNILLRELTTLYDAFQRHQPSPLAPLPIQYIDFALWQRQWLQGEQLEHQLSYWKENLAGATPLLKLPLDHPRPLLQSYQGAHHRFTISEELAQALKHLCLQEGVTLFMALLAVFQILLARYSDQVDIMVGTPIANRTRPDLEQLIGFFVNTLVLRTNLGGQPNGRELLRRVREVALQAYAHQDVPFEQVVEAVHPPRSLSYTPLFQCLFILQNAPLAAFNMEELTLTPVEIEAGGTKFDLTLSLWEVGDELHAECEYNTDIFEKETIQRLVSHYLNLLQGLITYPDQSIFTLPLLTPNEQRQQVVTWNQTASPLPAAVSLHELIEAQVVRTPQALALIAKDRHLSYMYLDQQANQLAHHLQSLGVGPEVCVGVCLPRISLLPIALLAILKAGGAYVPLDPAYPQARLAFLLDDSQVPILLTHSSLLKQLPSQNTVNKVLCLDTIWEQEVVHQPTSRPESRVLPTHLAYLIYTSGSTGQPKAVALTHQNVVTFLHWARECYSDEELSVVLAMTSICFDLSIYELFAPLAWGGTCLLVQDLWHYLASPPQVQPTLLNMVPSALTQLLAANAVPSSVRTVNLAGEALSIDLVKHLYQQTGVQRVFNLYGPSEATTYATGAFIAPTMHQVPIGRPVVHTQAYILDAQMQPVPIGVEGELYLGGAGVARGYLKRPDLTSERFVPDPLSGQPGQRLYRTGDRVKYLSDGQIEFLGRADQQIKLHGFRIELGEVEAVIQQHPAVSAAVVQVWGEKEAEKRLVGYVVGVSGFQVSVEELRRFLQEHMPNYMIPAQLVVLETLPLTPNGKIDRQALPPPGRNGSPGERPSVAPRTPLETSIASIWEEVLQVKSIGVYDDFFEIGGHSLVATQVISRLRAAFQVELPLAVLFETTTIAGLAEAITQEQIRQIGTEELEQLLKELE